MHAGRRMHDGRLMSGLELLEGPAQVTALASCSCHTILGRRRHLQVQQCRESDGRVESGSCARRRPAPAAASACPRLPGPSRPLAMGLGVSRDGVVINAPAPGADHRAPTIDVSPHWNISPAALPAFHSAPSCFMGRGAGNCFSAAAPQPAPAPAPIAPKAGSMTRIAIIYYSTYSHVRQMAEVRGRAGRAGRPAGDDNLLEAAACKRPLRFACDGGGCWR